MESTEKIISLAKLRRNNGDRGAKKWIADDGIVYDVTDCLRWRKELHEGLHFAGQDLTAELPEAPHKRDVFSRPCIKVVGKLKTPGA